MKKFLKENKTLAVLFGIALICIIVSVILLFKYFYFGNGGSKYGDRLDGIVNVTDDRKNEITKSLNENDNVKDSSVIIMGKIIYIKMNVENISMDEAKNIALKSLDILSDDEKKSYDIQFTLKEEANENTEGFLIMGAKNVNGTNLVWTNTNYVTNSEEEK